MKLCLRVPHVLLIDHYDSFTGLIKSYFKQLGAEVLVVQSDDLLSIDIETLDLTHVVLSPGPGHPSEKQATIAFILKYYTKYPMLGVCLGHQCLIHAFGGDIIKAGEVYHGKCAKVDCLPGRIFRNIQSPFMAARYHSWMVSAETLPPNWQITAWVHNHLDKPVIMGLAHQVYPLFGVQFHPEAVLTDQGLDMMKNFLEITG